MTYGSRIAWDDTVLPFQLDAADMRGRVARLDAALEGILGRHDYPPQVEALVTEMALLTALIGQTVKLRWKLSLQVQSNGPVRTIATDYFAPEREGEPARIRAWAGFDRARLAPGAPFAQIGAGHFAILIDQGRGTAPYQGITPLTGGSLAACAESYFAQSEQLPTRFVLGWRRAEGDSGGWRAGGIMLQHLPGPAGAGPTRDDDSWNRVNILLDTVREAELTGPDLPPPELLVRLFHEEGPRVFDAQAVRFGCTCSEARVRQSLSIYSARDIATMVTEDGRVTADCQFCGAHYDLDPRTLGFEAGRQDGERNGRLNGHLNGRRRDGR